MSIESLFFGMRLVELARPVADCAADTTEDSEVACAGNVFVQMLARCFTNHFHGVFDTVSFILREIRVLQQNAGRWHVIRTPSFAAPNGIDD